MGVGSGVINWASWGYGTVSGKILCLDTASDRCSSDALGNVQCVSLINSRATGYHRRKASSFGPDIESKFVLLANTFVIKKVMRNKTEKSSRSRVICRSSAGGGSISQTIPRRGLVIDRLAWVAVVHKDLMAFCQSSSPGSSSAGSARETAFMPRSRLAT